MVISTKSKYRTYCLLSDHKLFKIFLKYTIMLFPHLYCFLFMLANAVDAFMSILHFTFAKSNPVYIFTFWNITIVFSKFYKNVKILIIKPKKKVI